MRNYTFDEETSCPDCQMDDTVTNINLVAVAVYGIVNNLFHTRPRLAERRNNPTKRCCLTILGKEKCKICLLEESPIPTGPCGSDLAKCTEHTFYQALMLEVNDLLTSAGAELVDTTKTVHELLFGFKDPIFVELADRLAGS